jgi:glycine cleavage system H protein
MAPKNLNIPENRYYTKEHEWALVETDQTVRIGITDHAQDSLHEIVYVDLPKTGLKIKKGDLLGTVESVKAVSEVFSPASGEIIDANTALDTSPELVNREPYGNGWIAVLKPSDLKSELKMLLTPKEYADYLSTGDSRKHS